jgi:cyclohexa-1,5-dienecarbonyl-CoA hydratase
MSVRLEVSDDGVLLTLTVDSPPGNVLDIATCDAISGLLEEAAGKTEARLLVVRGAGKHFSFGASVEEHLPETAEAMLHALGRVVCGLRDLPIPTLAAVQGRCLGGGVELALACGMLWVEEGAVLATPEIRLGVFAPAATALLSGRLPQALAEEMLLTGRDLTAEEAVQWGRANRLVPKGDFDEALAEWAGRCLRPLSASSLRVATAAWRDEKNRLAERLALHERRYLKDLLPTHDGNEGIRAFLDKREPNWENR